MGFGGALEASPCRATPSAFHSDAGLIISRSINALMVDLVDVDARLLHAASRVPAICRRRHTREMEISRIREMSAAYATCVTRTQLRHASGPKSFISAISRHWSKLASAGSATSQSPARRKYISLHLPITIRTIRHAVYHVTVNITGLRRHV